MSTPKLVDKSAQVHLRFSYKGGALLSLLQSLS